MSKPSSDWNRLDTLRDEDLDTSDIPEPTYEQFARAVLHKGLKPVPPKSKWSP